ncbi:unnamed protein product [Leptidea sinapis]|uniref:Uncharacterized protein n=1 Tax=Leptidea sinapis TaxID=189913 RepID=A0A5E4PR34_9NEOP|nr:unnamed protein product [Leptidea sinapis]
MFEYNKLSQRNDVTKRIFPMAPHIDFPHFMLLTLPAVIILETFLYFWLNFYYLGMFRSNGGLVVLTGMSAEEAQYFETLLKNENDKIGKLKFHEVRKIRLGWYVTNYVPPVSSELTFEALKDTGMMHELEKLVLICAGSGLSIFAIFVVWFTIAFWSRVIWDGIIFYPDWAESNLVDKFINS